MQPIIIASLVFHELPMLVSSCVSTPAGAAMTAVLKNPTWFPLLYGLGVFVFSLSEVADTTPKQMTDYLNAVR